MIQLCAIHHLAESYNSQLWWATEVSQKYIDCVTFAMKMNVPEESDFSIANIPFGIFSTASDPSRRAGTRVGDHVIDLWVLSATVDLGVDASVFCQPTLNDFASLGQSAHALVRTRIIDEIERDGLKIDLVAVEDATMHLPMAIGDYTDFYAGIHHAAHAGALFRGPANALQPNYTQMPVAYNGRASSIVVSGTDVERPCGQTGKGIFGPCQKLDFELELGAFVCQSGRKIKIQDAGRYIFGYVLLNDWSARDIQAFEGVPLGPFNSKNFATSISPWVVLPGALEDCLMAPMPWREPVQKYLQDAFHSALDIELQVDVNGQTICETNTKYLYWSFPQMITHHSVGGCNLRTGDLFGSGTISGEDSLLTAGCLLEMTDGGKRTFTTGRTWLERGDVVRFRGGKTLSSGRVGFGECIGRIQD